MSYPAPAHLFRADFPFDGRCNECSIPLCAYTHAGQLHLRDMSDPDDVVPAAKWFCMECTSDAWSQWGSRTCVDCLQTDYGIADPYHVHPRVDIRLCGFRTPYLYEEVPVDRCHACMHFATQEAIREKTLRGLQFACLAPPSLIHALEASATTIPEEESRKAMWIIIGDSDMVSEEKEKLRPQVCPGESSDEEDLSPQTPPSPSVSSRSRSPPHRSRLW